jgi:hypothetical protein
MLFTISIMGQQANDEYKFPIKPGMSEWKSLKTHKEMLKVISLPDNIKQTISTSALVKTCLNYPLFIDIYAYDDIKSGFMQLRKDFNGFNELLNRKDAFTELLKLYDKQDPDLINGKNSLLEKGDFTTDICNMEILFTQPEILKNLSTDQKHAFLKIIYDKHNKMLKHSEFDIRSIESKLNIFYYCFPTFTCGIWLCRRSHVQIIWLNRPLNSRSVLFLCY